LAELIAGGPRRADDGRHQILRPQAQLVTGWHTRLGADHPDTVRSRERLAAAVVALENRE